MRSRNTTRAVSPVIVAVLLIVVIFAGVLLGFIFLTGLSKGFQPTGNTGLASTITPQIYNSGAAVSYLNQGSNFSVVLHNTVSTPQVGDVQLDVGDTIVATVPFSAGASRSQTILITQPLNQTGTWTMKVTSNGVKVNVYSFTVYRTQDEADYAITQYETEQFYRNLIIISFFISIIAFAIAAASLARRTGAIRIE
jgi:hypothetical protein